MPLKLTVATDGSAKIRSPLWLAMVKLSNVAVWFVPPRNAIAPPADVIVPPPVATMEAPFPCRPMAVADGLVVGDGQKPARGDRARGAAPVRIAGEKAEGVGARRS